MSDRRALRKTLRAARAALTPRERALAAARVARAVAATYWLQPGRRIALYAAVGDELDTAPLLALAHRRGCEIYFPRLENWRERRMTFSPVGPKRRFNRYGILEPATTLRVEAAALQVIFLPLVGFDAAGNRLGMGAGFYDRALQFRRRRRHWRGPLLVGLGYACQQTAPIEASATDIPLDAVVTEDGLHFFRGETP